MLSSKLNRYIYGFKEIYSLNVNRTTLYLLKWDYITVWE